MQQESEKGGVTDRSGYSPAEFAARFGRHPSWAYRKIYAGKVNVIEELGRLIVPDSELTRLLGKAGPYNPKPRIQQEKAAVAA